MAYKQVSPSEIEIVSFDRKNPIGYDKEEQLPRLQMVEDGNRTVTAVIIDNEKTGSFQCWARDQSPEYKVTNPKHVFDYGA